jgi:hypothetical protein
VDLRVLAVSGDAGGAAALAPVLTALRSAGACISAFAYEAAGAIWSQAGVKHQELPPAGVDPERLLETSGAQVVLATTSLNGTDWERKFVWAARRRHLPSIVLLDFWSNYRERFTNAGGALSDLPDYIAVMDGAARDEMVAAGFPPDRLVITGQPAFDGLEALRRRSTAEFRCALRNRLKLSAGPAVLFCSQPIAQMYGKNAANPNYLGYTEVTVLRALADALQRIAERKKRRVLLLVRPHPREQEIAIAGLATSLLSVRSLLDCDELEAVLAADLVTGMSSILLLKAALLDCRALSLQPGLLRADSLPSNRLGLSVPVYTAAQIERKVEQLLFPSPSDPGPPVTAHNPFPEGATGRVVELVEKAAAGVRIV